MPVEIVNLRKAFGDKLVFDGLNATLPDSGVVLLEGASGSGKTTFINILLGLLNSDGGYIRGHEKKRLSVVFQEDRLLEGYTASENITFVAARGQKVNFNKLLEQMRLADSANETVSKLSGGMKRRIAIARALAVDFDILILDEPFKGLDLALKTDIMSLIKHIGNNKLVIFISHEQSECEFFKPCGVIHF